jgi:hypothetical protein
MAGLGHRDPGPIAAAALRGDVALGLIADGVHVAPAMAVLLQRLAPGQVVLVSDALAPYGLAEGRHRWDERTLIVANGSCRLEDGTLAGVTLPLLEGARRLAGWSGRPEWAIAAATVLPRRVLGERRPLRELLVVVLHRLEALERGISRIAFVHRLRRGEVRRHHGPTQRQLHRELQRGALWRCGPNHPELHRAVHRGALLPRGLRERHVHDHRCRGRYC